MNAEHGHTPAAWTGTILIILASMISTLGLIVGNWIYFWGGVGLSIVAIVIWVIWEKSSKVKS